MSFWLHLPVWNKLRAYHRLFIDKFNYIDRNGNGRTPCRKEVMYVTLTPKIVYQLYILLRIEHFQMSPVHLTRHS